MLPGQRAIGLPEPVEDVGQEIGVDADSAETETPIEADADESLAAIEFDDNNDRDEAIEASSELKDEQ